MQGPLIPSRPSLAPSSLHIISALIGSAWVGVCAAAPEFLLSGAQIAIHHSKAVDLASILVIAAILACFIDPLLARAHGFFAGTPPAHVEDRRHGGLHAAALAFVFAVVAVLLVHAVAALLA